MCSRDTGGGLSDKPVRQLKQLPGGEKEGGREGAESVFLVDCSRDAVALGTFHSGVVCRSGVSASCPSEGAPGGEGRGWSPALGWGLRASRRTWPEEPLERGGQGNEGGEIGCGGSDEERQLSNNLHLILP